MSVAVIIAAYNAEASIARAIESALAQPEANEVVIVDDASCDATVAIASAWAGRDNRVRVLTSAQNRGPAAARNRAIATATSPWITVLDSDDYMLNGRLGRLLARTESADFAADALIRTTDATPISPPPRSKSYTPLNLETFLLGNLGRLHGPLDLGFLKPIMSRAFLDRHGLRYREDLRLGEDYELYARALALGARFLVGGAEGYISVERVGSLSKQHSEADLERLRDCDAGIASIGGLRRSENAALKRHWRSVDCRLQWRRLISAVKQRELGAALTTFLTPHAALYLATRLAEQAVLRSARAVGLGAPS